MIPVSRAEVVRGLDAAVISELGVPGQVLMELAGRGAAEAIQHRWPAGPVGVLCGSGNNGGDGYVVARWLSVWGRDVRLWAARPPATPDASANAALCAAMGIPTTSTAADALSSVSVAVDAMLGTGQRAAPRGTVLAGVRALRACGAPVAAMDLPTGLAADTGQFLSEDHVQAALTVTFGRHKPGLLCEPGATLCGEVVLIDIGLDLARHCRPELLTPDASILEPTDISAWRPLRTPSDAKWDRGHVAIRAGGGAAVLTAHGAFRAGAGLVTLLVPRAAWSSLHGLWPEVILAEPGDLDPRRHDVLVIGPGLGLTSAHAEEVREQWRRFSGPLVADADALTLLASGLPTAGGPRVITPHSAEAGRLLSVPRSSIDADRFAAARSLAELADVALLKGPNSLIRGPAGTWVVPVRCSDLGTAGSGDVLAGLIGGALAQTATPQRAVAVAAWHHAHAGLAMPPRGTASDLLEALRLT